MSSRIPCLALLGVLATALACGQETTPRRLTNEDASKVAQLEQESQTFRKEGKYAEALASARRAQQLRRQGLGADHWETRTADQVVLRLERLVKLSTTAQSEVAQAVAFEAEAAQAAKRRRTKDAVERLEKAVELRHKHLGEDDTELAATLSELAYRQSSLGSFAPAEASERRALAIRRKLLGEDHPDTIASLNYVADYLQNLGRYAEAEPLFREALELSSKVQGDTHRDTVALMNNLASCLIKSAKLKEAESLMHQVLAIREKLLGPEHLDTATACNNLGAMLAPAGRRAEADTYYRRALAIRRKQLGDDHVSTALSCNNVGSNLDMLGRYTEAEPLHRQALDTYRRLLGAEHPSTARSMSSLGTNLNFQGRYAEAEQLEREALATRRKVLGETHPDTAKSHENLATNLCNQGRYAEAERGLRQGLEIRRKTLGENHPETLISLNNCAAQLAAMGKLVEGESLMRETLSRCEKELGPDNYYTLAIASNLGTQLYDQGKTAEALVIFRKLAAATRDHLGEEHPQTADALCQLAGTIGQQGQYAEAETLYSKAFDLHRRKLGEAHPSTLSTLNGLALNLRLLGRAEEAEAMFRDAIPRARQTLGPDHPDVALLQTNHADVLLELGKSKDALNLYREVLKFAQRVHGEDSLQAARALNDLGGSLCQAGQLGEGEVLLRKAATIAQIELGPHHQTTVRFNYNHGIALWCLGRHADAQAAWRGAAEGYGLARLRISGGGLERASFSAKNSPLLSLASSLARDGRTTDAWNRLEEDLARGLLDDLAAQLHSPADQERERALLARRDQLDKQFVDLMTRNPTSPARQEIVQARHALEAEFRGFESGRASQVCSLADVQARLPSATALLAWVDRTPYPGAVEPGGEHWACLLKKTSAPVWVRLAGSGPKGDWETADSALPDQVRNLLIQRRPWAEGSQLIERLRAQRLQPLRPHLKDIRHLIVLPSSAMAGIPIEALTDDFLISYVPSGTVLARLLQSRDERAAPTSVLALGDPVFGKAQADAQTSAPKPLPGTRREVEAIAALFPSGERLLGAAASEQMLDEINTSGRLAKFDVLHLATHGLLDERLTLQSCLLLSQDALPDPLPRVLAGKKPFDGRLTAQHVRANWKLNAQLVTLSACDSGLGQFQGGEGHLGFSQALLLAGARSLIVSQWQVSDTATALLMIRFYENWLGKRVGLDRPMSKAEALKEAKLWLRNITAKEAEERLARLPEAARGLKLERDGNVKAPAVDRPFAHPYYWSPFILIGDPS